MEFFENSQFKLIKYHLGNVNAQAEGCKHLAQANWRNL